MKPTKEIIEKAARRGALLQNVQVIMWEFTKKRESDKSVNWIEYAAKIIDLVEGKDTPEGKLISTYKDKLWDKNLELDPDDDTPKETWEKRFLKEFVNTHNETWRPLRGLWVEDVLAFIAKELDLAKADMWSEADAHEVASDAYKQGKAEGAREVIEAVFQQIATMDGIKCEQERDIFRLLATLREDYHV